MSFGEPRYMLNMKEISDRVENNILFEKIVYRSDILGRNYKVFSLFFCFAPSLL